MARVGVPVIPQIAQAFQNDPRTKMAQGMIQAGTSGAPVAGGGWGGIDGLARVLQAGLGGYQQNKQGEKYEQQQSEYMQSSRDAIAQALGSQQAVAAPQGAAPSPMTPPPAAAAPQGAMPVPGGGGISQPSVEQWTGEPGPMGGVIPQTANMTKGIPRRFSSGELASAAREFIPGVNITSGVRTTKRNAAVGGKPNSQHVRGTAIDILPPKGMSPDAVRQQYAAAGAQVDVIDEGDHFHIQGARNPKPSTSRNVAAVSAPVPVTGMPAPQQRQPAPETPLPPLPEAPQAPVDVGAVQSQRQAIGQNMVQSDNPFAFMQGQEYLDKGLTEQNNANESAADRKFRSQEGRYNAAMGDYYGARADARKDTYDTRRQEREFAFTDQQAEKAFGRQLTVQERGFAHDMQRAGYDRQTSYGLAELNNNADLQRTYLQINASRATAEEKAMSKRSAFLSTPQGTKMMNDVAATISKNDDVISEVKNFLAINDKEKTGGAILGTSFLSGGYVKLSGNKKLQEMEAITAKLAPMLRTAGSGAMSDKDLEGFRKALPSINNLGAANKTIGTRIMNSMTRVNDFEQTRVIYASEGRQVDFLREWKAFKDSVPVASGKTFDDWRSSIRTVK